MSAESARKPIEDRRRCAGGPWRRRAVGDLLPVWLLLASLASSAAAEPGTNLGDDRYRWRTSCERNFASLGERARSQQSMDLYNGMLWFGGAVSISLLDRTSSRWSGENAFDDAIRDGMRISASNARADADRGSDVMLAFQAAILPVSGIGAMFLRTGDCIEAYDMATDAFEALGAALFVAESLKSLTGRRRPYLRACNTAPPSDADCSTDARFRSFVSGHAALAGAGAGLACSFAYRREAWGTGAMAKAVPCGLGIAGALAVGTMRVASDRHWGSDVLAGLAAGALVGYFDTWGPFDLLRFERRRADGRVASRGIVLPRVQDGTYGFQVSLVY